MVRRVIKGHTAAEVTDDFGVSERTAWKWLARYCAEGQQGLTDHSSRPHRLPTAVPPRMVGQIEALRQQRWTATGLPARLASIRRLTIACSIAW